MTQRGRALRNLVVVVALVGMGLAFVGVGVANAAGQVVLGALGGSGHADLVGPAVAGLVGAELVVSALVVGARTGTTGEDD